MAKSLLDGCRYAFVPLRLCAFAPLCLCAFAPLRLCAVTPILVMKLPFLRHVFEIDY
jgi:hypothetical protein